MIALLILGLAQFSLPIHMPTASGDVPVEDARRGAGRDGVRGYRTAERIFADATDIRRDRSRWVRSIVGRMRRDACPVSTRCAYYRHFPLRVGRKTGLVVAVTFQLSGSGNAACATRNGADPCGMSLYFLEAGNEAFPQCIRAEPIRRALLRHGWRSDPWRHDNAPASERYGRADDPDMRLFLRTLGDSRCFRSIYIAWIRRPPLPPSLRNGDSG
jgi:hypothetical protein